ncbi:hypothetical protein, partial [Pantoea ananatis]|uniref:hypothetical protein n=1 Tax=Pantoea ananas TaxID=553 RepID=UPI001C4013A0
GRIALLQQRPEGRGVSRVILTQALSCESSGRNPPHMTCEAIVLSGAGQHCSFSLFTQTT